jgi:hypothetical protein
MHTLIVTFYAYKGGTGRTLALSNVARYLADELGYRIGLIDLDLESLGLVHEPLCAPLEQDGDGRANLLDTLNAKRGFVDCFLANSPARDSPIGDISEYVCALGSGRNGSILLMPAGRGSVRKEPGYTRQVDEFIATLASQNIALAEDLTDQTDPASLLTWNIIQSFAQEYQLDFLFIDGRTGTTPFFSPIYTYSVPNLLVLFSGLNEQNVLGSFSMLQIPATDASSEIPVVFVLSPVPTAGPADYERRLAFVSKLLADARSKREQTGPGYRYELPVSVDHFLPYSDAAAFGEVYFPGTYPHSLLAAGHRALAMTIAEMAIGRRAGTVKRAAAATAAVNSDPIDVAFENVHADILTFEAGGINVKPHSYPAEHPEAPWEKLLKVDDQTAKEIIESGHDVIAVPQTHLQQLTAKGGGQLFYDLNGLRFPKEGRNERVLNYEFLDKYYPNWRRWCSTPRGLAGLPITRWIRTVFSGSYEDTAACIMTG